MTTCRRRSTSISTCSTSSSRSSDSLAATASNRTLSGIYAHPDDETFSGGGTYSKYAAAGVRCTIYCATDGDAGKTSGLEIKSKEELGAVRRKELGAAAKILGIQHCA